MKSKVKFAPFSLFFPSFLPSFLSFFPSFFPQLTRLILFYLYFPLFVYHCNLCVSNKHAFFFFYFVSQFLRSLQISLFFFYFLNFSLCLNSLDLTFAFVFFPPLFLYVHMYVCMYVCMYVWHFMHHVAHPSISLSISSPRLSLSFISSFSLFHTIYASLSLSVFVLGLSGYSVCVCL